MPDLFIFAIAATALSLAVWMLLAGDREQDIEDEEPTLNTRGEDVQFTTSYDDDPHRSDDDGPMRPPR